VAGATPPPGGWPAVDEESPELGRNPPVADATAPRKGRPWGLALALVLGLAGVAVAGWSLQRTDVALRQANEAALALEAARGEAALALEAARGEVDTLARRVDVLEAEARSRPDQSETAERVRASVFSVVSATGRGSAWVVAVEGSRSLLVTNFHVVGADSPPGARLQVLREGLEIEAEVVTVDEGRDLAVLAVGQRLPALPLAEAPPRVGDPVLVVGSPLGLEQSVVSGIVSALRTSHIQISAPLNPGNSGGPVVDADGRVIGVAVLRVGDETTEAIGLAIPVAEVCALIAC
jgi:putative serine protease PepD